jgi:hypothetical protein
MDRFQSRCASHNAWPWGGLLASLVLGCGPTQSTAIIMDAEVQLEAATTADAEKLAPYEWTGALAYLHKAREEQGYSDYEVAIDFAEKARKLAREAKSKAMAAKSEGALPNVPPGATRLRAAEEEAEK